MSSTDFVYGKARKALNTAQINWSSAAINAMLVSSTYAPQPNTDQYVSDVPAGAVIVRDIVLTSLGVSNAGVCFGTLPPFNAFSSPLTVTGIILYVKGADDAHSPLVYYSSTGPGFPFHPQGFNYTIGFDQANGGYFQ